MIQLAGGVALFLYGMTIMGAGLEKVAGGKMQSILQKLTSSTIRGILLGTFITGIIQSSAVPLSSSSVWSTRALWPCLRPWA